MVALLARALLRGCSGSGVSRRRSGANLRLAATAKPPLLVVQELLIAHAATKPLVLWMLPMGFRRQVWAVT